MADKRKKNDGIESTGIESTKPRRGRKVDPNRSRCETCGRVYPNPKPVDPEQVKRLLARARHRNEVLSTELAKSSIRIETLEDAIQ